MTRFNGVVHGMRTTTIVLPGEDGARYQRLYAALVQRHDPQDQASLFEVERAAGAAWKMLRGEAVEAALATRAINDVQQGSGDQQAEDAERLGAELASDPSRVSRQLRRTPAGCTWSLSQLEILQTHLASHKGLFGSQRHRALHLVGKRMGDVLAGDPVAVRWFLALIGARFGNKGDTVERVAKELWPFCPEAMSESEFDLHVKDLAGAVPDRDRAGALLKAYLAEAIAALKEQLALMEELQECNRALAVQAARIDLGAAGKQLLKYQATQERSYDAAQRRLDARRDGGRRGPGRPPNPSDPRVVPAAGAAVTTATPLAATTEVRATDSEAMVVTTTNMTAATVESRMTIEPTSEPPARNFTTEAKTVAPAAPIAPPAGDFTSEATTATPAAASEPPARDFTTEAKTATPAAEMPHGTTHDGPGLSPDRDESDRDAPEAEFLRQRELHRLLDAVYGGRAARGAAVAGAAGPTEGDGRGPAPVAPGADSGRQAPRPQPLGGSVG
jgi:hypothetical protein